MPNNSSKEKYQKLFGERVRLFREKKGMTKTALADLIGKERQDIWAIEEGQRNTTLQTIVELSKALEVPLSKLMDFKLD